MAGISDKFNGSKTRLYVGTAVDPVSTVGLGEMASTGTYTSIAKIIDLGTIQNEANVIDVPEFGQDYAGKLVGQLNAGTLDMSVAWDPSDANHIVLKDAVTNKTRFLYIINWWSGGYGANTTAAIAGRWYTITAEGGTPDFSSIGGSATAVAGDVFRCTTADADITAVGGVNSAGATIQEADETFVAFNAYVASFGIETTIDDAVKASVSLAIDGALQFF